MSSSLPRQQPGAVKVILSAWDTVAVVYMLELIRSVTELHSSKYDALSSKLLQELQFPVCCT